MVITDDLESVAIETLGECRRPRQSGRSRAGCDMLLYATQRARAPSSGFDAVVKAVKKADSITREQLQAPYDRVADLKDALGSAERRR